MKRVLVIGGGVIGLSTAYYCATRGCQVTVLERGGEDHDGCSFGNAGMIVPSHFIPLAAPGMVALGLKWMWNPQSPFYIKPRLDWDLISWSYQFWRSANARHVTRAAPLLRDLSLASRACFEELEAQCEGGIGLVKRGLLMLCKSQQALDEESHTAERARSLGIPAEVLSARQATDLDPAATMDIAGAIYFPKDCHLSPQRFMSVLKHRLDLLGVAFHWNAEVTGWRTEGRRISAVMKSQEEFGADEYVVCGGSWSQEIVRQLGQRIPMQAGKGYSLTLTHPRQLPRICSILTEARVAVTPMDGQLRFGGTMEMAGLNEEITHSRVQGIIRAAMQYYPAFEEQDFEGIKPWRGLRPCSPDGLPYLGRTKKYDNLLLATGHAMMGLSLGPISGKLVADLIAGERPALDLALLSPDRW